MKLYGLTPNELKRLIILIKERKLTTKEQATFGNLARKAHWTFWIKNRINNTKELK